MSHEALNKTQFHDVDPHQQALPGMEHLAHPWAGPLSKGFMLKYEHASAEPWEQGGEHPEHELQARDTKPRARGDLRNDLAGYMTWASSKSKRHGFQEGYAPGEVTYIMNRTDRATNRGKERGRGLASALFHAAHHFDFGQSTVPIHSPVRTRAGDRFAAKTRPDLRPDISYNSGAAQMQTVSGERTRKTNPEWDLPEDFHPYQRQARAKDQAVAAKMRKKRPVKGQGALF